MDGGVGGGNILRNVAEEIVTGGSGPGQTSRAVPGTLDFSNALDQDMPVVTPDPVSTETNFNNFGNWNAPAPPPIPFPENPTAPRPNKRKPGKMPCCYRPARKTYNSRPFAPLFQQPDATTTTPSNATGDTNMAGTWPEEVGANPDINYGYPIGPQVGPNAVSPSGGCGGNCSCRRKYTCEEKCAYNAQMKEQCKGCKSYFRKTKQWVRPKRRYYRRKRTYRRKRKSSKSSSMYQGGTSTKELKKLAKFLGWTMDKTRYIMRAPRAR